MANDEKLVASVEAMLKASAEEAEPDVTLCTLMGSFLVYVVTEHGGGIDPKAAFLVARAFLPEYREFLAEEKAEALGG